MPPESNLPFSDLSFLSTRDIRIIPLAAHPELVEECLNLRLCESDREEMEAAGEDVGKALRFSVLTPTAHAGIADGKVHGVFGIYQRIPWCLTDGWFKQHLPLQMHKVAKGLLNHFHQTDTPMLYNFVHSCSRSREWLKRLGFHITEVEFRGKPFLQFTMDNRKGYVECLRTRGELE